jgi:hypothetical protein
LPTPGVPLSKSTLCATQAFVAPAQVRVSGR